MHDTGSSFLQFLKTVILQGPISILFYKIWIYKDTVTSCFYAAAVKTDVQVCRVYNNITDVGLDHCDCSKYQIVEVQYLKLRNYLSETQKSVSKKSGGLREKDMTLHFIRSNIKDFCLKLLCETLCSSLFWRPLWTKLYLAHFSCCGRTFVHVQKQVLGLLFFF